MKKHNVDLTSGNVAKGLLLFVLPVLLSSIFQSAYNVTNSMIVGNYVSKEALSAVSACNPITSLFSNFFNGLGLGCGILIARRYGAGKKEDTSKSVESILIFSLVIGLITTLFAELFSGPLLSYCNVKSDIFDLADTYLKVYFIGNAAVIMYNMCFHIMRSLGDSSHPLYYLIFSTIMNIFLGLFFVRVIGLKVAGVALASIISQTLVVLLSIRLILKHPELSIDIKHLHFDVDDCKEVLRVGIPTGVQYCSVSLAMLLVQSYVNMFPNAVIAGIGVSDRISGWGNITTQAFGTALTTYVSQNIGAGDKERVKQGVKFASFFATGAGFVMCLILFLLAPQIVGLFNKDPEVIHHGTIAVRTVIFCHVPFGFSHYFNAACRGAGNIKVPTIISISTQCVARYLFCLIGMKLTHNSIIILYIGPLFTNTLCGLIAAGYYFFGKWPRKQDIVYSFRRT